MGYHFFPSIITVLLLDFLHTHLAWKLTVLVLIATDIKTFPLVWHASLRLQLVGPCLRLQLTASVVQCTTICPSLAAC